MSYSGIYGVCINFSDTVLELIYPYVMQMFHGGHSVSHILGYVVQC